MILSNYFSLSIHKHKVCTVDLLKHGEPMSLNFYLIIEKLCPRKLYAMISLKRKFNLRKANRLYHRRTTNHFSLGLGLQIILASLISDEIAVIRAESPFPV